jgi:hypothetical protein
VYPKAVVTSEQVIHLINQQELANWQLSVGTVIFMHLLEVALAEKVSTAVPFF